MEIKITDLSFKYDRRSNKTILNHLNLTIKEGTINVLLGLNGCGKTTLIKLLAGLEKPTEGMIEYDNKDLKTIKIIDRSKKFSYVSQYSNTTSDIPVRQYLSYGTTNTLAFYNNPGEEEMKKVIKVANRLNITHLLDKKLGEISGGELQIVLIACALIQDTPIVLLDEPTSALDLKNQFLVLSTLKEIAKEGKTIILSTHNPNHASFLNANVILLHNGLIMGNDLATNIIVPDKLRFIYGEHICYSKSLDYNEVSFK